jgi:hypothetical protein
MAHGKIKVKWKNKRPDTYKGKFYGDYESIKLKLHKSFGMVPDGSVDIKVESDGNGYHVKFFGGRKISLNYGEAMDLFLALSLLYKKEGYKFKL